MPDLSQTVFPWSTNKTHILGQTCTNTHIYTNTHKRIHKPTIAIGENAMRCISPKIVERETEINKETTKIISNK